MPRSRQAVTTFWRSDARRRRDRDDHLVGLGVVEDARRARRWCRAPSGPPIAHALLARVVVDEADRDAAAARGCGAARRPPSWPPLPAPTISTSRALAARCAPRERALDQRAHEEARAAHEREREQEVERDHAARRVDASPTAGAGRRRRRARSSRPRPRARSPRSRAGPRSARACGRARRARRPASLPTTTNAIESPQQLLVARRDRRRRSAGRTPGTRRARPGSASTQHLARRRRGAPSDEARLSSGAGRVSLGPSSSRFTSSRGSRRTRSCAASGRASRPRSARRVRPACAAAPRASSALVDRAQPALERRVDGRAERDRLAVHGTARRDDQVREGHQALARRSRARAR